MKGPCDTASTGRRTNARKSAAGRKVAGYHMHLHGCPSRRHLPTSSFLPSGFYDLTVHFRVRRKRLRDLNLDACITSVFERDAHDHCGALGKKSDIHEPNPVSRSADQSIRCWKMSRCRERRDECLTCIHIFDRTTRARGKRKGE